MHDSLRMKVDSLFHGISMIRKQHTPVDFPWLFRLEGKLFSENKDCAGKCTSLFLLRITCWYRGWAFGEAGPYDLIHKMSIVMAARDRSLFFRLVCALISVRLARRDFHSWYWNVKGGLQLPQDPSFLHELFIELCLYSCIGKHCQLAALPVL